MALGKRLTFIWFVLTMPAHGWCQSTRLERLASRFKPDSVIAFLNDSTWHGRAFTSRESRKTEKGTNELSNHFYISFLTYKPYTTFTSDSTTTTQSVVSQWLSLSHVPITTGTFNLSDPTIGPALQLEARYDLLEGGDSVSDSYHLAQSTNNWIRIIRYDSKKELLTGAFSLRFINRSGRIVHFTNGLFKARVVYELK